jgi:hypothetical protein
MPIPTVGAFDTAWGRPPGPELRQHTVDDPSGIKPGDWLADLGTLRQIEYVDTIGLAIGAGVVHIVHFVRQDGVENLARGFSDGASLTVWRSARA